MIKLIKSDIGYTTRFVTINHIYSKVPIYYTIKSTYKKARPRY